MTFLDVEPAKSPLFVPGRRTSTPEEWPFRDARHPHDAHDKEKDKNEVHNDDRITKNMDPKLLTPTTTRETQIRKDAMQTPESPKFYDAMTTPERRSPRLQNLASPESYTPPAYHSPQNFEKPKGSTSPKVHFDEQVQVRPFRKDSVISNPRQLRSHGKAPDLPNVTRTALEHSSILRREMTDKIDKFNAQELNKKTD